MMCAVIFVAESLPTFGPLLDLVGGSTLTLTSLVFPCFFYLYLIVGDEIAEEKGLKRIEKPPSFAEYALPFLMLQDKSLLFTVLFKLHLQYSS